MAISNSARAVREELIPGHARCGVHGCGTPIAAKEIVYQAVPYVGMAKVFDFINATNEVLTERGIRLPRTRNTVRVIDEVAPA
jgi:alkylhydroperoxidase/carboxymuconolactone decarboxylase family protein YurZ